MYSRFCASLVCATTLVCGNLTHAFNEGELLVWINGDKGYRGLAEIGKLFEEELGIPVKVEAPEGATDKFQQAAQSGKGPDIFFWPHDRLGEWASAGLLSPIEVRKSFKQQYSNKGWEAFTHNGELWGYPVSLEAVGLIYNKAQVTTPPAQLKDIPALHKQVQAKHNSSAILWDYQNTYFTWGVLASGGGYVFGTDDSGNYTPSDVGVATEGSIQALQGIVDLIDSGVMPRGASYSVMEARMNQGEVAMMISGPWAWANLRKSGIDFGVAPVPGIDGNPGRPFVGVLGAMLNRASPNKELAVEFLENYVLTDEGLATIDKDVPLGVPAKTSFYEALASDNELIAATQQNIENGVIMPNVPEMGRFWSSMAAALQIATNGQAPADQALKDAASNMTN
ncbi:maltose/maltodextrin ABC transporter substrate-binding protein MalE [Coraliomargarita akajimensis]|uniref:Extracellular solute-binding protein family 1 n=1 Tax=Coraliomargarita akajimensis (strain DSM 45221 / IAM 15411 / JCM 23193 / KCTC 12865 / 04OKA010-24) TaxID=583355 RepID=D5EHQ3_CORAD|nr:maltose/maltodextrin ABC transporter substrate-binding protein MalE [Coraliomargarita akajimensis]ADE54094.1 extracellular solute-binding protein family 1 [Coraliomargarita akajimensis DSM 45221]